jgi:hypothetical protein
MAPIGFKSYQISLQGIFLTIFGVGSSMFTGIAIKKYHRYKLLLRVYATGSFVILLILMGMFQTENVILISINLVLAACCLIPIIPVSIDFSSELTYPIEQTVCTGFLLMSAQGTGFVLSIIVLEATLVAPEYGLLCILICVTVAMAMAY